MLSSSLSIHNASFSMATELAIFRPIMQVDFNLEIRNQLLELVSGNFLEE